MNLVLDGTIRIAAEFDTLEKFRAWSTSGAYPERGDYFYLNGDLWFDLSMETFLHNQLKSLFLIVLGGLLLNKRVGRYFGDRMRLVNVEADISCEPDGMFVSDKSEKVGRVRWEQGADSLEIIGTPDMVLEVVSKSSIQKDSVVLRDLYAAAGIQEYWLVNPLAGQLSFEILRLTSKGYSPVKKVAGWVKSGAFGKSFRLVEEKGDRELAEYNLLVK
jgi:Uma2 family endonuclease